jgi:integrase
MAYTVTELDQMKPDPGRTLKPALKGRLGIYLWIYPSGEKTWMYRDKQDKMRKLCTHNKKLCTREYLLERMTLARDGKLPGKGPQRVKETTIGEAWAKYVDEHLGSRSSRYKAGVVASWDRHCSQVESLTLSQMDTSVTAEILAPLVKAKHNTTANRIRATISHFCNWSYVRWPKQVSAVNWIRGIPKAAELPKQRVLDLDELAKFGAAWKRSDAKHKYTVLLLLLTASRGGAFTLRWEANWILERRFILFPPGVEGPKKAKWLILGDAALKVLPKTHLPTTTNAMRHCLDRICEDAGIQRFSAHVMRKTFSSLGADWGFSENDIDAIQNHRGSAIRQAYVIRSLKSLLPTINGIEKNLLRTMNVRV